MKVFVLFLLTISLSCSFVAQENPWRQSNSAENPWRQTSSNENPWGTNASNDTILGPKVQNVLSDVQKRNPVQFGFDAYIAPGGIIAPSVIAAIPVLGIIALPLIPIFTTVPVYKKGDLIKNKYLKKYPDANAQELNSVIKGINRKRWRNTGIGMAIGAVGQAILLALII